MRQGAGLDRRDLLEIFSAKYFYEIKTANRDISELVTCVAHKIDVVRDRTGIQDFQHLKWRPGIEGHDLADVLQRQPDLCPIRRSRDIGTERAFLLHPADGLLAVRSYNHCFGCEAGAN